MNALFKTVLWLPVLVVPMDTALAGPCTSLLELNTLSTCHGTSADAWLRFRPTGDRPEPTYALAGAFVGQGQTTKTVDTSQAHIGGGGVTTFGTTAAISNSSGSAVKDSGDAVASADLRTGAMRVFGTTTNIDPQDLLADGFSSTAKMSDMLHLTIPKSLADFNITFWLDIDGMISGGGTPWGSGTVQAQMTIVSLDGRLYDGSNDFQATNGHGEYESSVYRTITDLFGATDAGDSWLLTVQLDAALWAQGNPNFTFDFSHTARLRLDLSPGITWVSDSGILLVDANPRDVPEPSTTTLLLAALAAMWPVRRIRPRRATATA